MNDEEMRQLAGRAMGLTVSDMRFFNPLQCARQTLEIAQYLLLDIGIDSVTKKTTISKCDVDSGFVMPLVVELHSNHGDNVSLAMRYAVLKAAAQIGMTIEVPIVQELTLVDNKKRQKNFKHSPRAVKLKTVEVISA